MKKLTILFTILMLILSITACGSSTTDSNDTPKDTNEKTESAEIVTDNAKEDSVAEAAATQADISASKEILNASIDDNIIQIGETILQSPFTYSALLDLGHTPAGTSYTPDYLIDSWEHVIAEFSLGDGSYKIQFTNLSDSMCSLNDLKTFGIQATSSNVFFSGGVHTGMTISDLKTIWGEPDQMDAYDDYSVRLTYGNRTEFGTYIQALADRNTSTIHTIFVTYYTEEYQQMLNEIAVSE